MPYRAGFQETPDPRAHGAPQRALAHAFDHAAARRRTLSCGFRRIVITKIGAS
jgi:hypothetical protein